MSVIVAKRRHSEVQFLENARALEIYTLQKTIKMPKRWNHFKMLIERCVINCYTQLLQMKKYTNNIIKGVSNGTRQAN